VLPDNKTPSSRDAMGIASPLIPFVIRRLGFSAPRFEARRAAAPHPSHGGRVPSTAADTTAIRFVIRARPLGPSLRGATGRRGDPPPLAWRAGPIDCCCSGIRQGGRRGSLCYQHMWRRQIPLVECLAPTVTADTVNTRPGRCDQSPRLRTPYHRNGSGSHGWHPGLASSAWHRAA
jgi:hypothetical protein